MISKAPVHSSFGVAELYWSTDARVNLEMGVMHCSVGLHECLN